MHFGEHLMIDGYHGNPEKLNNRDGVFHCLDELPDFIGVKKLSKPEVYLAPDTHGKDPGGWSGFVVISTSHISIHTFPARGFVSIDVYTCQNGLDVRFVTEYFVKAFELKETEVHFVKRGTKYPVENIFRL